MRIQEVYSWLYHSRPFCLTAIMLATFAHCSLISSTCSAQANAVSPAPASKTVQSRPDISGSWKYQATVPDPGSMGAIQESYTLDLEQVGNKITGTLNDGSEVHGSIDGSKVTLNIARHSMGNSELLYTGTLIDTYTLRGTIRVPGAKPGSWIAKRGMNHANEILSAAEDGDLENVKTLLKENPALVFCKDDGGDTPLLKAVHNSNADVVKLLLAYKSNVNARDVLQQTPLHGAAAGGHREVVELLLARGAEVNARTDHGQTPLHFAAEAGAKDVVELLLAKGAAVNAKNYKDETPLDSATGRGEDAVADLLRKHGGRE